MKNLKLEASIRIKLIPNAQYGFYYHLLTLTNLLITDRIINKSLNDKASFNIIKLDFVRAFD